MIAVSMSFDKKIINEVNRRLQEVRFINPGDSLKESFVVVEEMIKEGIIQKYALAGAIGAMCYIEPFDTRDADFIIEFPEGRIDVLGPLFDFLVSRGYQDVTSDGYVRVGDWPIQFVAVTSELKQEALDTSVRAKLYPNSTVSVLRAEYLAAEALSVGRSKDHVRLERLLEILDFNRGLFDGLVKKFELTDKWNRFSTSYGS
jgi:hypothetical protein